MLLKKLFESHISRDPTEELVKAAAEGDAQKVEELLNSKELPVSLFSEFFQIKNCVHLFLLQLDARRIVAYLGSVMRATLVMVSTLLHLCLSLAFQIHAREHKL